MSKAGRRVISCHKSGNFIVGFDLQLNSITPEEMNEFLEENQLSWSVADLGPVLGTAAFFYEREPNESTTQKMPTDKKPIDGSRFDEIKFRYEKKTN